MWGQQHIGMCHMHGYHRLLRVKAQRPMTELMAAPQRAACTACISRVKGLCPEWFVARCAHVHSAEACRQQGAAPHARCECCTVCELSSVVCTTCAFPSVNRAFCCRSAHASLLCCILAYVHQFSKQQ